MKTVLITFRLVQRILKNMTKTFNANEITGNDTLMSNGIEAIFV